MGQRRCLRTLAMPSRARGSGRMIFRLFISHSYFDAWVVVQVEHHGSTDGLSPHGAAQMRNGAPDRVVRRRCRPKIGPRHGRALVRQERAAGQRAATGVTADRQVTRSCAVSIFCARCAAGGHLRLPSARPDTRRPGWEPDRSRPNSRSALDFPALAPAKCSTVGPGQN